MCISAEAFILNSCDPSTQILREILSPRMKVFSVKVTFTLVSDQSPSDTYE